MTTTTVRRDLEAEAAQRFVKDTAEHQMTIELDEGLYRRLCFRQPGTGMYWFDVITWPGTLTIRGDMGTYVFARVEDMFEFFRGDRVNPQYWAEKVVSGRDDVERYSPEMAREMVLDHISEDYLGWRDYDKEEIDEIVDSTRALIRDERFEWGVEGAHDAISEFSVTFWARDAEDPRRVFRFEDVWDWGSMKDYTIHFLWCLHAIVHAIKAYDAAKK